MNAFNVLCAQLTRDLLAIAKFLFFSAEGGPILIKFRRLVDNDNVHYGDMVKLETRCRISIWRTFGRIPFYVIPEPPATLQGAAIWRIHCRDSRVTCHIAWCSHLVKSMSWSCHIAGYKNSILHIEIRFSPYFIFLFFKNAVWALTSDGFRIVFDTLVLSRQRTAAA